MPGYLSYLAVVEFIAVPVSAEVGPIVLKALVRVPTSGINSAFADLLYIVEVEVKQFRLVFAGIIDALAFTHICRPGRSDIGVVHTIAFRKVDPRVEVHPQIGKEMKTIVDLHISK